MGSVDFDPVDGSPRSVRSTNVPLVSSFTVGMMVKIVTYADWVDVFAFNNSATNYLLFEADAGGAFYLAGRAGADIESSNIFTGSFGGWFWLFVTGDGTTIRSYYQQIGGAFTVGTTINNKAFTPSSMSWAASTDFLTDSEGRVRFGLQMVADRVWTINEMRQLIGSREVPSGAKGITFWNPCKDSTDVSKDYSGKGGAFTITGTHTTDSDIPQAATYAPTIDDAGLTVGAANTTLTAEAGTYTLTGNAATLTKQWKLTAAAGSYTVTGNNATLTRNVPITAATGSYTLTGNAATLTKQSRLTAATGAYTLTGNAATLTKQWKLTAATGTYNLTGNDATLTHAAARSLTAETGVFTLTGNAATLTKQWRITAAAAAFILTGNAATLTKQWRLAADTGSYTYTGVAAALKKQWRLTAETGVYALTGNAATLTYSGAAPTVTPAARTVTVASQTRSLALSASTRVDAPSARARTITPRGETREVT